MADSIETMLSVRVSPRSSRNEVVGIMDDVLHVRLTAPPVQGKANYELVNFLSNRLGLAKSYVEIMKGHTARNKVIVIRGLSREDVIQRLLPG